MRKLVVLAALALVGGLFAVGAAPALASPGTLWVNDDDPNGGGYAAPGTSCDDPGYSSIQAAIDAAVPGDTVQICPGTYTENINITKWVVLDGAGSGSNPASDSIITAAAAGDPTIQIQADGASATDRLVIRDVRVTGATGSGNPGSGIEFDTAGDFVTIDNVAAVGNEGHGINADLSGVLEDIVIVNSVMSDNLGAGFNQNSYVSIDGLTITDSHADSNAHGLYFEGPLTGLTLSGGTFSDNGDVGIYATRLNDFAVQDPISLSGFTAEGNKRGVIFNKFYGPFSMSNATVSNNSEEGIAIAPGANVSGVTFENIDAENNPKWGLWVIAYLNFTVSDVTIDGGTYSGSNSVAAGQGRGIYLYAVSGSTLTDVSITGLHVSGNTNGIYLRGSTVSAVTAHGNCIQGNTTAGLQVEPGAHTGTLDAENNYWGDASGPSGVGPGSGDAVIDPDSVVDFDPWAPGCPLTPLDHFLCYGASAWFRGTKVSLSDEFGEWDARVKKVVSFCNPVDKDGEGIFDPTAHLACYDLSSHRFHQRYVTVSDQFGEQILKIVQPESLCVPSEKDGVPSDLNLDHFECYKAVAKPWTPRFQPQSVSLVDQFGEVDATILGPVSFCNPVNKNGEGIINPDRHLTCYKILPEKSHKLNPWWKRGWWWPKPPTDNVWVENQFGDLNVKVRAAETLCVPSEEVSPLGD
jgi:nitrous oxidase accessory protein NosD